MAALIILNFNFASEAKRKNQTNAIFSEFTVLDLPGALIMIVKQLISGVALSYEKYALFYLLCGFLLISKWLLLD